jgi:HK97 family phage portal protein
MGYLSRLQTNLMEFLKAPLKERLPSTTFSGNITGNAITGGVAQGTLQQMATFGDVSWLHAVVSMIMESASTVPWHFYRERPNGDKVELPPVHPLVRLWERPNPYMTGQQFREIGEQTMCLTGERWWVILRDGLNRPRELWPIRPDRIAPIPHATEFVSGYVYRIGATSIPLEPDDVVFDRIPSPLSEHRGIGPVQSLLVDLGNERAAAQWTNAFFGNSAAPGGVIEFDHSIDDATFERLRDRWATQHRGVANAHRVAIIEQGTWKERKYTQRDMQFEQLRRLTRDIILGAFRMPTAMMGISESVNLANALAAETHFGRWVIKPRLLRQQNVINTQLAPFFGSDVICDFDDPTPEDRELNLAEAERGYNAGILTLNEARSRLGESMAPDNGDDFKTTTASPFTLSMAKAPIIAIKEPEGAGSAIRREERRINKAWEQRLEGEALALGKHLANFMKGQQKLEPSDLDSYNWDWATKFAREVEKELKTLYSLSITDIEPDIPLSIADRLAGDYAELRTDKLLRMEGSASIVATARKQVNDLVSATIERGDDLLTLQDNLIKHHAFNPAKAATIARTETAYAHGAGAKGAALERGDTEKRWVTQGPGADVSDLCLGNESEGWINIAEAFSSGDYTIPQHPNCRCNVLYRSERLDVEMENLVEVSVSTPRIKREKRCPRCRLYLGDGTYCRRCKAVTIVIEKA